MRRRGFTLIELMIVIVIIVILISILTPAIGAAIRNAREGSVQSELSQIDYGLEDFKAHFGQYPPSAFDLRLYNPTDYTTPVVTGTTLKPATQATLRQFWPNINMPALIKDLQDNPVKQVNLDGSACLVFWLGGIVLDDGGQPMGFSNNPRSPLQITATGQRVGPFFEFKPDRLYDADPATFNGYEGYLDPLPGQKTPYQYIRKDQYATAPVAYKSAYSSWYLANRFQVVSAGWDMDHGTPQVYDAKEAAFVTWADPADPNSAKTLVYEGPGADNMTNFHSGPLID